MEWYLLSAMILMLVKFLHLQVNKLSTNAFLQVDLPQGNLKSKTKCPSDLCSWERIPLADNC